MKVNAGFKIDDVIKQKLEWIADQEGISYADLCRMILFNSIKQYEHDNMEIHIRKISYLTPKIK